MQASSSSLRQRGKRRLQVRQIGDEDIPHHHRAELLLVLRHLLTARLRRRLLLFRRVRAPLHSPAGFLRLRYTATVSHPIGELFIFPRAILRQRVFHLASFGILLLCRHNPVDDKARVFASHLFGNIAPREGMQQPALFDGARLLQVFLLHLRGRLHLARDSGRSGRARVRVSSVGWNVKVITDLPFFSGFRNSTAH